MKLIYRLFKQDPEKRESIITMTSGLGVAHRACQELPCGVSAS